MKNPQHESNIHYMFTAKLAVIIMLMTTSTISVAELKWKTAEEVAAEEAAEAEVAYVDSVKSWGAWELDIEPAAGGLTPPSTGALNARNSKVAIRTNSFSALAPTPIQPVITNAPTPTPTPPVAPPTPQIPTVINISPSVPIPVGAP